MKKLKNHLCLRLHSKSNHLNPGLSPHGARRESVTSLSEKSRLIPDFSRQIQKMMKEICELLNELDAGREKFFIDRRTKVNGVITLHTPQEEIGKLFVKQLVTLTKLDCKCQFVEQILAAVIRLKENSSFPIQREAVNLARVLLTGDNESVVSKSRVVTDLLQSIKETIIQMEKVCKGSKATKEVKELAIESIVVLNSTESRLGYLKHLYEKIIEKTSLVIVGT